MRPRWSARSRLRPTSAPVSRSSMRCARAVLAVRLGELAGASAEDLSATYYVALLHASGCTSNGHEAAQLYGDDIAHRAAFFLIDATNPAEVLAFYRAYVGRGPAARGARGDHRGRNRATPARGPARRSRRCARSLSGSRAGSISGPTSRPHSSTSSRAGTGAGSRMLGATRSRCRCDFFMWRGTSPSSSRPPGPTRRGQSSSGEPGAAYEPRLAELAVRHFGELLDGLDETRIWEQAHGGRAVPRDSARGRPGRCGVRRDRRPHRPQVAVASRALDERGRPRRGGGLAARSSAGLPSPSSVAPRSRTTSDGSVCRTRSGRSPGRSGSASGSGSGSIRISRSAPSPSHARSRRSDDSRGPTTSGSTAPAITAARAERRSTFPRASWPRPTATEPCARRGRTGPRSTLRPPRRSFRARSPQDGSTRMRSTRSSAPPGTACAKRPRDRPAGLTERELEVLLVLVRGGSNQQIADGLGISAKTVGHHVQHVYQKVGVRSRAAATVWAFEHNLVHTA